MTDIKDIKDIIEGSAFLREAFATDNTMIKQRKKRALWLVNTDPRKIQTPKDSFFEGAEIEVHRV
jgi:hypothetical protein